MLVLTRKVGEVLVIGQGADAVKVAVTACRGGKVLLGVDAPQHVSVDREEVRKRKDNERNGQ